MPKSFAKGGRGGIGGSTGATDNAILRADGTGGSTLQNSLVTISDTGVVQAPAGASGLAPSYLWDTASGVGGNTSRFHAQLSGINEMLIEATNRQFCLHGTLHLIWGAGGAADSGSYDVGVKRVAANILGITNASTGLGWLQTAGDSRVAATVTNSTVTPANITGLSATVAAGRTYTGTIVLHYNQSVAADGFRFDLDGGTATATDLRLSATISDSTSTRFLGQTTALATDLIDASTSGNALVTVEFTITVNVAGTLIPRFALEALSTGVATVYRGSWMKLDDIA